MKLSLQLFTVKTQARKNLPETLARVAELGYRWVEPCKLRPSPQARDAFLHARTALGLGVSSAQVAYGALNRNLADEIDFLHVLDCSIAVVAMLPPAGAAGNPERLKAFCQGMNRLSRDCLREGIRLAFHHHHFEFARYGEKTGMELLLEELSGDIGFVCDTYWAQRAGIHPPALIHRLNRRLCGVHLRDGALHRGALFFKLRDCPLGDGALDIPQILEAARLAGAQYAAVEQRSAHPFEDAARSFNYAKPLLRQGEE